MVLLSLISLQITSGFTQNGIPSFLQSVRRSGVLKQSAIQLRCSAANDNQDPIVSITSDRRRYSQTLAKLVSVVLTPYVAAIGLNAKFVQPAAAQDNGRLVIPLSTYDGVYCMNYTVNGNQYRGIVDTGSPFLIVPSVDTTIWGYTKKDSPPYTDSGLSMTTEIFGGQDYETYWKVGDLDLPGANKFKKIVFANVGEDIMRPPGGVFVGLIKYKADDIRPTLLGQLKYSSIQFDSLNKELILSKSPLISTEETKAATIKMDDLRVLGDPVYHYAAKIKSLEINGRKVASNSTIYAVFDTGTTGCVLSDDLMNDYETPNPIRKVRVILSSERGEDIVIETGATRDEIFVVTAAKIPWFTKEPEALKNYFDDTSTENINKSIRKEAVGAIYDTFDSTSEDEDEADEIISANISRRLLIEPQVVVIGLSFFKNKVLTIDIDQGRLSLTPSKVR